MQGNFGDHSLLQSAPVLPLRSSRGHEMQMLCRLRAGCDHLPFLPSGVPTFSCLHLPVVQAMQESPVQLLENGGCCSARIEVSASQSPRTH